MPSGFPTCFLLLLFFFQEYDDGDLLVHYHVALCASDHSYYFLATIYTIKGLLLAFGTFLAWETRKV